MSDASTLPTRLAAIAAAHPDADAILAPGRVASSYATLVEQVQSVATALGERGIGPGDRVVGTLARGPEAAACVLGVAACATYCPLDPGWTAPELGDVLRRLAPRAVICAAGVGSTLRDVARALRIEVLDLVVPIDGPAGTFVLEGGQPSRRVLRDACSADDHALILCTSGTTGRPKLVPLRHRHLVAIAAASGAHFSLGRGDRVLHTMSMFYANGLKSSLIAPLLSGCAVICPTRFDPRAFLEQLTTLAPTWYAASYAVHGAIAEAAATMPPLRTSLRFIVSGAGRLDARVADTLQRALGAPVLNRYSMSETGVVACEPLPPGVRKRGTAGCAVHNEIRIVDANGAPLPPGVEGEILVRGPAVFDGYLDDDAHNARVFRDGWFVTGDRGTIDADGYVTLTGRARDVVNRGGEKIAPLEVERILAQHPSVADVAVFGVAHRTLGEDVAAAIVASGDAPFDAAAIVSFAADRLARFKVPRRLHVVDALPLTSAGKVDRRALAARFGAIEPLDRDDARAPSGALENDIAGDWRQLLDVERVARDVDFFVAGGDSLRAATLFARLAQRHGVDLPLRSVYGEAATIAGQAAAIDRARGARPRLPDGLLAIKSHGAQAPVFAAPGRDADLGLFVPLAARLSIDRPLVGLVPPGIASGVAPMRVEDIAAVHVRAIRSCQPDGPYHLLGACFGGFVAYEIACQLRDAGHEVALLALVDPPPPFTHASGARRGATRGRGWRTRALVVPRFVRERLRLYAREWRALEGHARRDWLRAKLATLRDIARSSDPFRGDRREIRTAAVVAANEQAAAVFRPRPYAGRVALALAHERPLAGARNHRLDWLAWLPQAGAATRVPGRDTGEIFRAPNCTAVADFLEHHLLAPEPGDAAVDTRPPAGAPLAPTR